MKTIALMRNHPSRDRADDEEPLRLPEHSACLAYWFPDELETDSIVVATLDAVTDAREKAGAVVFRMQLNDPIFR
jgi:hypothetical protein